MDTWQCSDASSSDPEIFTYTFTRMLGEPLGETKTIQGGTGQFTPGSFYSDDALNVEANED